MVRSKALIFNDFESEWYKKWARKLKQTNSGRGKYTLRANKFWQNAIITQVLYEKGVLTAGKKGLGFGVGTERLPALFASNGVKVTATDQDFKASGAQTWDNDQLAHGSHSLNKDGICPEKTFKENVSYRAVNMKKIPKDLYGTFNFLWSNCALGHLGSIENGLAFIEESLKCLKGGGYAVHTTELNILSDSATLDNSNTVFFRQKDLYDLFVRLSKQGYIVSALRFRLGKTDNDMRFTLSPEWGNDFSKILFNGHMATQAVIIIQKPRTSSTLARKSQVLKHSVQYRANLLSMAMYRRRNKELASLIKWNRTQKPAISTKISLVSKPPTIRFQRNETKKIRLKYSNLSGAALFIPHSCFAGTNPITITRCDPINRDSAFAHEGWPSANRPSISLFRYQLSKKATEQIEYVKPGEHFSLEMELSAKDMRPGIYEEQFCLIKEGDTYIPSTEVKLIMEVT
jgi:hypothetical protein